MSSPTLGSHTSYEKFKTIAGQVEKWVREITVKRRVELGHCRGSSAV